MRSTNVEVIKNPHSYLYAEAGSPKTDKKTRNLQRDLAFFNIILLGSHKSAENISFSPLFCH